MPEYENVLVPTDGSKGTQRALDHAVTVARNHDATLHGLYVIDQRRYLAASKDTQDELIGALEEEGELALDDVKVAGEEAGLTVQTEQRQGIPEKEIMAFVEEGDVDVVVMGTHGRTGRDRVASMGSVTERVIGNVAVPVLVVNME